MFQSEWSPPRVYIGLGVGGTAGTSDWRAEIASPNELVRKGPKQSSIPIGGTVLVEAPRRMGCKPGSRSHLERSLSSQGMCWGQAEPEGGTARETADSGWKQWNPQGQIHFTASRLMVAACRGASPRQYLLHDLSLGVRVILHERPLLLNQFTLL